MRLFHEIRAQGYIGKDATVRRYLTQVRKASGIAPFHRTTARPRLVSDPTARQPRSTALWWMIVRRPDTRTDTEQALIAQLHGDPTLAAGITITQSFVAMVRDRIGDAFAPWVAETQGRRCS